MTPNDQSNFKTMFISSEYDLPVAFPANMIVTKKGGIELFQLAEAHSESVKNIITSKLPELREKLKFFPEFVRPFDEYAFFLLSNVLLDNWQIENIEREYLKQERPLRGAKRFYIASFEQHGDKAPFGIYGNSFRPIGNNTHCWYGNKNAAVDVELPDYALKISEATSFKLYELAEIVKKELVAFFEIINSDLRTAHLKSQWSQTDYPEFFIWWYHFLYTQVTNDLAKNGFLKFPESGFFSYLIIGAELKQV